ncbi:MBL fold metallo-hydrolase [Pseudomonas sp. R5(2019)]|uniref:MBL fold metallo-hydrolase n=1 Tax=Pseudomonas sp. R5(2019) TaxID=2697566 RepID=UPI001411ECA4|nr:MBL fold metallo-hydrolase [Pseudomonas sp. R5(2019)]NBA98028.1 MBL fold metallo-hydrolase [Pseudomonas sp. R5(2019)]
MVNDEQVLLEAFLDESTSSFSYLLMDRATRQCAVIDSVLNYTPASGRTHTEGADRLIARVRELNAAVQWILETHMHADHLCAAAYLKSKLGGRIAISSQIVGLQQEFGALFNCDERFRRDGSQFDALLDDGQAFTLGNLEITALHTPGHTPACATYVVRGDGPALAFVGDTLFMPDYGTARCDFPGGDARTLYRSIRRILALPADTHLLMCHDYCPNGRPIAYMTTVAEQRSGNIHAHEGVSEDAFVAMREQRDAGLTMPALMLPAVQVNMRGGQMPEAEDNGVRYMKIPIDVL